MRDFEGELKGLFQTAPAGSIRVPQSFPLHYAVFDTWSESPMIIAGWILAIVGLAQVVYAGSIDVSQLVEGNRVLGIAPSVVANADLVGQRSMIHQSGCATFLAGALFLAAAYLKPPPQGPQDRSWYAMGAIAAGSLAVVGSIGFGLFLFALNSRNENLRELSEARIREASAASLAKGWDQIDRGLANGAAGSAPPGAGATGDATGAE